MNKLEIGQGEFKYNLSVPILITKYIFRVLEMEKKKEEIEIKLKQENTIKGDSDTIMKTSDTETDEDEDIPEFIDWRSKKSHK